MIKKQTSITITYGDIDDTCVRVQREEDYKGELYIAHVGIITKHGSQELVLTNEETYTLYRILIELVNDGELKCIY